MKEYYIWLLSVMGAANPRSIRLISRFGGVKEVYEALTSVNSEKTEKSGEIGFLKPHELKSLKNSSLEKSRELLEWCEKHGYGVTTIGDPEYPEPLKHIFNPPIVLFSEGDVTGLNADYPEVRITVIGTRKPSEYSMRVASCLCSGLAQTGITIVSGMAVGLDKCAMTAAFENSGKIVGVLACGIDVEYPKGSKSFRKSVAESGGVCLSELMPRDGTRPTYFHQRNRLMSGLSQGTLIVEAREISGCHITALHAINQNRDLFCVPPHDILDPRYSGVVRYLRDGAIPVFSHIDIINEYLSDMCKRLSEEPSASPKSLKKSESVPSKAKKPTKDSESDNVTDESESVSETPIFKTRVPMPQPAPKADYSQIPEDWAAIVTALQKKKLTFDEIVKKKLCEADKAYEVLLDMELDGLIERISGDRYAVVK